jgi:type IV secretory pathway TrbD component
MNSGYEDSAIDEISMRSTLYATDKLFGMEPFLAQLFGAGAFILMIVFQHQLSIAVALLILGFAIPWLRRQGKIDPQWSSVMIRATFLQKFYPATSYINVKPPALRKQQRVKRAS